MSSIEAFESKGLTEASFPHPPLSRSRDEGIGKLIIMLTGWNGKGATHHFHFFCRLCNLNIDRWRPASSEYARVVNSCKDIINTVDAGIIIVDSFFNAACEACWSLNKRYIVNCPMAPLDVARGLQPIWKSLLYYPV